MDITFLQAGRAYGAPDFGTIALVVKNHLLKLVGIESRRDDLFVERDIKKCIESRRDGLFFIGYLSEWICEYRPHLRRSGIMMYITLLQAGRAYGAPVFGTIPLVVKNHVLK